MKKVSPDEDLQPRAKIYMDKRNDNIFRSYEYIAWINKGVAAYKAANNLPKRASVGQDEELTEFLKSVPIES